MILLVIWWYFLLQRFSLNILGIAFFNYTSNYITVNGFFSKVFSSKLMSILGFHAGDLGLNIHEGAVGSCNQFSHLYVSSQCLKLSRDRCAIYHHSLSNVPEWRLPLVLGATKSWRRENELLCIVFSLNENSRFLGCF